MALKSFASFPTQLKHTLKTSTKEIQPQSVAGAGSAVVLAIPVPRDGIVIAEVLVHASDVTADEVNVYRARIVARNNGGTTTIVGTPDQIVAEEDATWNITIAANDTDDTIEVTGVADGTNATIFGGYAEWIERPSILAV